MKNKLFKRMVQTVIALTALFVVEGSSALFAKCFIFVHGHTDVNGVYPTSSARNYWFYDGWFSDTDMINTINADKSSVAGTNKYVVMNYNTHKYYWDAAIEVAGKINTVLAGGSDSAGRNCVGQSTYILVNHSMGGAVTDFIVGNANSTDPYYNYGGANFANIGNKISRVLSVQGAHGGTEAANALCGSSGWACGALATVVGFFIGSGCDLGTNSLQTMNRVSLYANSPKSLTYVFAGYEAIIGSSACLSGEDDGVIQYGSALACSGSPTTSYSTSNACTTKQETSNFRDAGQFHENHDDGRNDADRDVVLRVNSSGNLWGTGTTGSQVRSSDSSAEIIAEVWAD
jgi:hypothetical protein